METINKSHQKGEQSVNTVKDFLINRGFTTTTQSKITSNGYDIVAIKTNISFTVEVKTAFFSSRSWQIGKTHNKANDFIAIVFPNGIHFELWEDHKQKCSKNGKRSLTKIAHLYV